MEVTQTTGTAETEKRCKIQTSQLPIIKHSMSDTVSPTWLKEFTPRCWTDTPLLWSKPRAPDTKAHGDVSPLILDFKLSPKENWAWEKRNTDNLAKHKPWNSRLSPERPVGLTSWKAFPQRLSSDVETGVLCCHGLKATKQLTGFPVNKVLYKDTDNTEQKDTKEGRKKRGHGTGWEWRASRKVERQSFYPPTYLPTDFIYLSS